MISVMPRKGKATAAQKGKAVADEAASRTPRLTRAQTYTGIHIRSQSSPTSLSPEGPRGASDPAPAPAPVPVPPVHQPDVHTQEIREMRDAIRLLTQILAVQAGRQDRAQEYPDRAASARARDFLTLNPPEFKGTDPNADPQEFIDGMQRTLDIMKASATESVELAAYRLQGIAINWFQSWRLSRGKDAPPPTWQEFSDAFLRHHMPPELRRARVDRFLNLRQDDMSVREYSVEFDSLARYAPAIVQNMEDRIHRYVMGLEPEWQEACMAVAMQPGMDIARVQAYAQGSEDRKRQREATSERSSGQPKRARSERQNAGSTRESRPQYSAPSQFRGSQQGREAFPKQRQNPPYASSSQQQVGSGQEAMPPPRCAACGGRHVGQCRRGVCYTCGDPSHYARDCPRSRTIPGSSAAASSPSVRAPETGPQASSSRGRGGGRAPGPGTGSHRIYALGGRPALEAAQDTPPGMPFFR